MSTLSTTGQFVVTGLSSEKSSRDEENDVFQYPVGIASTAVNEYQLVSKELDLEVLQNISGQIQIINDKKQEAIGLGNSALGLFKPGVFPPICSFYDSTGGLNNDISSGNGVDEAVTPGPGTGGTATPAVAYSIVRTDAVRIRRYPYLESRTSPNDNALEDMKFPILTNTNAGQGEEDIWVKNSIYTDPDVGLNYYIRDDEGNWSLDTFEGEEGDTLGRFYQIDSSGGISTNTYKIDGSVSLGNVFIPSELYSGSLSSFFVGVQTGCSWTGVSTASGTASVEWNADTGQLTPILGLISPGSGALTVPVGAVCSDLATKQQQLLDEIDSTRVGITTWFVSVNTTKQRKHGSQLQLWSVERVKIRNQEETDGLNNSPRNIETTIPSVEAVDSELPTNSNTADADRGNLTADNTLITADSK
jgi:hypothetical protein